MAESTLRIYICGGHSTGKTTILKDLLVRVNIKPELDVARGLLQQLGLDRSLIDAKTHPENFENFQLHVMTRLLEIDQANSADGSDFICDRGIDPLVYAAVYLGSDSASRLMQTDVALRLVERLRTAELFVVTPHAECIADDGVRLSKPSIDELHRFTDVMFAQLQQLGIPHHTISVLDRQRRVDQIVQVVRDTKPSLLKTV